MSFLPLSPVEAEQRGWKSTDGSVEIDFICVTGDSYVDHPSFGVAIISRLLESMGFRVAIISQPMCEEDYTLFGAPRLGFFVTSGNIDSMVSHYTAAKRKRSDDPYTAGNKAGRRPDRAVIVYSQAIKRLYPNTPLMIGGLEASFRRFAHYDYWEDSVRPSILADSGADILSYGMGEHQTREIANRLASGEPVHNLTDIRGTCVFTDGTNLPKDSVSCASFDKVSAGTPDGMQAFARAYKMQADEQDAVSGRAVIQKHGMRFLVQNPPTRPLTREELDEVYELPFERMYHPVYEKLGGVKAIEEIEFSIMHSRGCFGGCAFCAISFHQGRAVTTRSKESVIEEARQLTHSPRFKGYIHDVGGPTANFRHSSCKKQLTHGVCRDRRCLTPTPCKNLYVDHKEYLDLLREMRAIPKVKKVFVRSGLRFDYINADPDDTFLRELVEHHISGQLKVAPEHCSTRVLNLMGKPHIASYERFAKKYYALNQKIGKKQYLVPYLMSSHPGSTVHDAIELALFLKKNNLRPEQVQDFYPTPGTASTCMFYTGLDPATMQKVYVPRTPAEKAQQRALLQYFDTKNRDSVIRTLKAAGRNDLIGPGRDCLVNAPNHSRTTAAPSGNRPISRDNRRGNSQTKYGKKPRNKR